MYYLIEESLREAEKEDLQTTDRQYVAVLTFQEWTDNGDSFEMGIDLDPAATDFYTTKAEVNYDSLTGSFSIPERTRLSGEDSKFAFALDEKGIVFIDDNGIVEQIIDAIRRTKRWKLPSLERFLYDFLDHIIKDDLRLMEKYELELNTMEQAIIMPYSRCLPTMSTSSLWARTRCG